MLSAFVKTLFFVEPIVLLSSIVQGTAKIEISIYLRYEIIHLIIYIFVNIQQSFKIMHRSIFTLSLNILTQKLFNLIVYWFCFQVVLWLFSILSILAYCLYIPYVNIHIKSDRTLYISLVPLFGPILFTYLEVGENPIALCLNKIWNKNWEKTF